MKRARNLRPAARSAAQSATPTVETAATTAAPRQLALDIRAQAAPSFANFVAGANAELVSRLKALATPRCFDALYLWGLPGSGRSHLLAATAAACADNGRPASFVAAAQAGAELQLPPGGLLIVDDAQTLSDEAQIGLFRAFNTARLIGLALLIAGAEPPARLALREDLRTRIGAALIYEVKPLTDAEKAQTLMHHAAGRGLRLAGEVTDYLLRRMPRDLPSLIALLDALDRASLERQRPLTIPLVREVLGEAAPEA
jgi:DnaA family protein